MMHSSFNFQGQLVGAASKPSSKKTGEIFLREMRITCEVFKRQIAGQYFSAVHWLQRIRDVEYMTW